MLDWFLLLGGAVVSFFAVVLVAEILAGKYFDWRRNK